MTSEQITSMTTELRALLKKYDAMIYCKADDDQPLRPYGESMVIYSLATGEDVFAIKGNAIIADKLNLTEPAKDTTSTSPEITVDVGERVLVYIPYGHSVLVEAFYSELTLEQFYLEHYGLELLSTSVESPTGERGSLFMVVDNIKANKLFSQPGIELIEAYSYTLAEHTHETN